MPARRRVPAAVTWDGRPATRDVDTVRHPSTEIRAAAGRVATYYDDLPPDRLNDGVEACPPGDHQARAGGNRLCGLTTVEEGLARLERNHPGRPIEAEVMFFPEELPAGDGWVIPRTPATPRQGG